MGVYYCKACKHYFYISSYWYRDKCKICDSDLVKLPIEFVDFVNLTEEERAAYIANN